MSDDALSMGDINQRVWEAIRAMKIFRRDDIESATDLSQRQVQRTITRLHNHGYIALVDPGATPRDYKRMPKWQLVNDVGSNAPAMQHRPGRKPRTMRLPMRGRIWRAIEVFKRSYFTYRDIAVTADVPMNTARKYLELLLRAGYLREAKPAKRGVRPRIYKVAPGRYTGPRWPKEAKEGVIDQQLQQLVYNTISKQQCWPSDLNAALSAKRESLLKMKGRRNG